MKRKNEGRKNNGICYGKLGKSSENTTILGSKTTKWSSEFVRYEMEHFLWSLGQRSEEGNLCSVEMCGHEFFLKHALAYGGEKKCGYIF